MTDIDLLLKTLELKDEKRTGWEIRGVERPESVADHSWGTAFLCLLYADKEGVNADRSAKIGLVHDIAEAVTGDIARRAPEEKNKQELTDPSKQREEEIAMTELLSLVGEKDIGIDHIEELWREYEDGATEEAVFAKDMNLVDLCLQALFYEKNERYDPSADNEHFDEYDNLDEFFATTETRLNTDTGKMLFEEIKERYEAVKI